jgi:hypothetical protein
VAGLIKILLLLIIISVGLIKIISLPYFFSFTQENQSDQAMKDGLDFLE